MMGDQVELHNKFDEDNYEIPERLDEEEQYENLVINTNDEPATSSNTDTTTVSDNQRVAVNNTKHTGVADNGSASNSKCGLQKLCTVFLTIIVIISAVVFGVFIHKLVS